jgi:hypothetical protein
VNQIALAFGAIGLMLTYLAGVWIVVGRKL